MESFNQLFNESSQRVAVFREGSARAVKSKTCSCQLRSAGHLLVKSSCVSASTLLKRLRYPRDSAGGDTDRTQASILILRAREVVSPDQVRIQYCRELFRAHIQRPAEIVAKEGVQFGAAGRFF